MSEYEYETIDAEPIWRDQIRKIATDHPVLGGEDDSPLNVSAKDIADCLAYLKARDWSAPVDVPDVGGSFVPAGSIPWPATPHTDCEVMGAVDFTIAVGGSLASRRVAFHARGSLINTAVDAEVSDDLVYGFTTDSAGINIFIQWTGSGTPLVSARHKIDWWRLY